MRRKLVIVGVAGAIAGAALTLAGFPAAEGFAAAGTPTFVVPSDDGYGIGECVSSGSACGKVVADAWCEAQGFGRSESFGLTDPADVTGALASGTAGRPISITCAK